MIVTNATLRTTQLDRVILMSGDNFSVFINGFTLQELNVSRRYIKRMTNAFRGNKI